MGDSSIVTYKRRIRRESYRIYLIGLFEFPIPAHIPTTSVGRLHRLEVGPIFGITLSYKPPNPASTELFNQHAGIIGRIRIVGTHVNLSAQPYLSYASGRIVLQGKRPAWSE